jgi:hypothetical protein
MPLNPELYHRLQRLFGTVVIANPDQPLTGYKQQALGKQHQTFVTQSAGERYRISCPYCRFQVRSDDTRQRLWISYRWGVPDTDGQRFWWAIKCYNENCLDNPDTLAHFRNWVYAGIGGTRLSRQLTSPPPRVDPGPAPWPGLCVPLAELRPDHHAWQYVVSRNFNPVQLTQKYQVHYCLCAEPEFGQATNRLVFPVLQGGKLVTWQARYIGETDWRRVAKYYNCPGRPNSNCLYGLDNATDRQLVVLVEGVTNVWRMGDNVCGLFRKTMSALQFDLIRQNWDFAVVMLDEDAERNARNTVDRLRGEMPCCWVPMPKGADPDSLGYEAAWAAVYKAVENYCKED